MFALSSAIVLFLTASALLLAEDPLCSRWQKNLSVTCMSKTSGFFKKFHEHQFNDTRYMRELNSTSADIIKCFDGLPCRSTRDNKMAIRAAAYRDTMFSLTDSFVKCAEKLESHNSECFFSWDPFLGIDQDGRILESFDKRDICKSYFGPKDCMRVEIAKHCDAEVWRTFKKKAKEFGEKIYGCDLRAVFQIPVRYSTHH